MYSAAWAPRMPANLTPDYLAAEQHYKQARTAEEKIAALEQMLATIPRHKGTEKMVADIKRRLSQARKDSQKKSGSHSAPFYYVKREGAGQIVLVGPPNSGKSSLLAALTHARPEIGDYPFTTHAPLPGMMRFEDVQIQLVDMPAISPDFTEPWVPQVLRLAHFSVMVLDPSDPDVLGETEYVLEKLQEWKLPPPKLLLGNKVDLPGAPANFEAVVELCGAGMECIAVSAASGTGLDAFAAAAFRHLDVVRFYSKPPGKPPDLETPYVLRRGETVIDAAAHVHRDIAEHLRYARLFRKTHEHDGLMVERSHVVEDEDILEFHA